MIKSCPYCLSVTHQCPRCEGPVVLRNITVYHSSKAFSTSLILCTNLECQNYGSFKQQTDASIVTEPCSKPECQEEYAKDRNALFGVSNDN